MQKITEAGLDAFSATREQRSFPHRLIAPCFWGKVTNVQGAAGTFQVQVQRNGDTKPDGGWYPVVTNGMVPVIGDQVEIQWRDERTAYAVSHVQGTPRVADQHQVRVRLYWTGSFTLSAGWNYIGYNNTDSVTGDPSGMRSGGDIIVPLAGDYLVVVKAGASSGGPADGIYLNGGEVRTGYGGQCIDVLHRLKKGDKIQGYIFVGTGGGSLDSGADLNWITVQLLNAV